MGEVPWAAQSVRMVAIDPGITTGYAVLDEAGQVLECGNIHLDDWGQTILDGMATWAPGFQVVIERTPIPTRGRMNRKLEKVTQHVAALFPRADEVDPGVWKNSTAARDEVPRTWQGFKLTQHQKDAIRLGRYRLFLR